jgi:hypothetical protein
LYYQISLTFKIYTSFAGRGSVVTGQYQDENQADHLRVFGSLTKAGTFAADLSLGTPAWEKHQKARGRTTRQREYYSLIFT